MVEKKYFVSDIPLDADRERLSLLEQTWDPATIRHFETLGVGRGWTCLDVGAGFGSTACWLAERVGPRGKVVATDIRPSLIRQTNKTIEIRQHDILKDEIEKGGYDLVHCRALLMHLVDPVTALSRMAGAVKPGGWLLIEELDGGFFQAADLNSESSGIFNKAIHGGLEVVLKRGNMNPFFGRKVRTLIDQLKFQDVGCDGFAPIVRGGEPLAKEFLMTLRSLPASVLAQLFADCSSEQTEFIFRLLQDPSFYFVGNTLFSAWGRKPR